MSQSMTIRLKTREGVKVIKGIHNDSNLAELLEKISTEVGAPPSDLRLYTGFPPSPISLDDIDVTLSDVPITNSNTIIVEWTRRPEVPDVTNDRRLAEELAASVGSRSAGVLVRRVVDADNSCLFSAFNLVMKSTGNNSFETRQLIARVVHSDQTTYSTGFLGRENPEYCAWILNETSWGGAIEISILSMWYAIEVCVVDTKALRINRFGEDKNYDQRVFVIYDGIHYDALVFEDIHGSTKTKFSTVLEPEMLEQALQLAVEANQSRQYTDIKNLSLKCLVCGIGLTSVSAGEHAKATGHDKFGEI